MRRIRTLAIGLMLAAGACGGGGSPSAPSVTQVSGNWAGTISDAAVPGSGPAQISINQSGPNLSGTWTASGPGGIGTGQFTGSVNGASIVMTLTPSVPTQCPLSLNGTVTGARMTGTYAVFNCTAPSGGSFTLTKQ